MKMSLVASMDPRTPFPLVAALRMHSGLLTLVPPYCWTMTLI